MKTSLASLDLADAEPGLYVVRCVGGEWWEIDLRAHPALLRRHARRQFPGDDAWGEIVRLTGGLRDAGLITVGLSFHATWTASAFPGPQRRGSEPVESIERTDGPDLISLDYATRADGGDAGSGPHLLQTHSASVCAGDPCCVHNPSQHHMREWPLNWRADVRIMERVCPHGIGHPDPDDLTVRRGGDVVHGCDGCCQGAIS